jgi:phosphatidylinositol-3-phosphatase
VVLVLLVRSASDQPRLSSINTLFVILFENTNRASITPSVAPYIRTTVVPMGAHATQYFNPRGNHPSEPNYIWLEAGGHLGLTTDDDASPANSTATEHHLVRYLQDAAFRGEPIKRTLTAASVR